MSMQQIMRWGHDFLRNRDGECLNLNLWGKTMCQKETPKNALEEISTQNGPLNFYSNSMSSYVSQ